MQELTRKLPKFMPGMGNNDANVWEQWTATTK